MPTPPPTPPSQSAKPTPPSPGKKAQDFAAVRDWPGYYSVVLGKPPRETLVEALDRFEKETPSAPVGSRRAIDLGCGEGRDTLELLRRGWRVLAIDHHPDSARLLEPRVPPDQRSRLEIRIGEFRTINWADVDLLNSSYSLPFCAPADFPALWDQIVRAIRPGGRFAGQLFGDRDTWAALPDRAHQTEAEARRLLAPFDVETFRIEERDDADVLGQPKHWHIIHIVARKR